MNLKTYLLIARSIVKLMHPLVEVVIHEIASGKIVFIEGGLSARKVGDPSLLETDVENWQEEINQKIYPKLGLDGRLIKSISIPINEKHNTKFLLCINCDVSLFKDMGSFADTFLRGIENAQPACLFKSDYQERMHAFLHQILKEKGWKLGALSTKEKREIVKLLFEQGAFDEKNAADTIAKLLGMGRATIFNYLKTWRMKNES
jgi:predicted transcriptional regulator YheO